MPAKDLSPTQLADAARLKAAFLAWKAREKAEGRRGSQEVAADDLGFGQSALSQYLNGSIPLNVDALKKFCRLLRVPAISISPSIVAAELAPRDTSWLDSPPAPKSVTETAPDTGKHRTREPLKPSDFYGSGKNYRTKSVAAQSSKKKVD